MGPCGRVHGWSATAGAGGRSIGKTLRNIIVFGVIAATLYLLLPRLVDTEETLQLIGGAEYALLALALVIEVVALLGYANLTRFVLRVLDIRMRLYEVLSVTVGSLAVSHLLSAGGVGGWVVTYNALRRRDGAARPGLRRHRGAAVLQLHRPLGSLRDLPRRTSSSPAGSRSATTSPPSS